MNFLITDAIAAAPMTEDGQGGGAMGSILILVGFVLIFYFLLWRPQSKRAKEHRELIGHLAQGDEVVTNGGIAGEITKVSDDFISLKIAENTEVKMQKSAVVKVLPKGTTDSI